MNNNQAKQGTLLDTTDCLEAVGVFRGWKNFLFVIVILCLLLLQVLFWIVNLELVEAETLAAVPAQASLPASAEEDVEPLGSTMVIEPEPADVVTEIEQAAERVTVDANVPPEMAQKKAGLFSAIKFRHLAWLIRFLDFVLILAAILHCLTMMFTLKVSLLGRLGGINHISRAFFLSLAFVVLLLPWQIFFGSAVKGAIYTPGELANWIDWYPVDASGIFAAILYYLRFTGYWLLVTLLLILSQVRSVHWTKATLRRLEVI
ncbi:MAG: hypothetical protein ACYS76_06925 [Planctomycetota bacterium]|jgi:hypothetical protein